MYLVLYMIENQNSGKEHHYRVVHSDVVLVIVGNSFEPADRIITQISDRTSDKWRHIRKPHRYVLSGQSSQNSQHRLGSFFLLSGLRLDEHLSAGATDHRIWLKAQKTVARDFFAALHGFQQERVRAQALNLQVGGNRR